MMIPSTINMAKSNIIQATNRHTATLFLFHGSGGTGEDLKYGMDMINRQKFSFEHIKIVYPTAPVQPYTPFGGMPSNVWFDRLDISNTVAEHQQSVDSICNKASQLIEEEVSMGIPINRIVIGGFSMGGCLSMHLAYRFQKSVAGCLAMSSFLNNDSLVYESLKSNSVDSLPELLQFHGTSDDVVPFEWGKNTFDTLRGFGVKGTFITLPSTNHMLVQSELKQLKSWLLQKLPNDISAKSKDDS